MMKIYHILSIIFLLIISYVCVDASSHSSVVRQKLATLNLGSFTCTDCLLGFAVVKGLVADNATEHDIEKIVVDYCIAHKIEDETVCKGIVNMFEGELFTIIEMEVSPERACGFLGVCAEPYIPKWQVKFPKKKPPHVPPVPPPHDADVGTILHLSDVHFDRLYAEGTNSKCGEPLCCREVNGPAPDNSSSAGPWGNYNCDLNPALLDNLMSHLSSLQPQPDFIFWTGDNPPHDVWQQTHATQLNNSLYITQLLQKAFPTVPVFPCLGNHEGVPVNEFPLPPGSSWLYDPLAASWQNWLDMEAQIAFRYGGYYDMEINGFKVISLNMNYCNNENAWLLFDETGDAGEQLQWLINSLQASEDISQRAYIIGHIPPGVSGCLSNWSESYYEIVNRYEDTIIAQFFGHTHDDEFEIFYDMTDKSNPRATSIAYITPSVTTYTDVNPSFRLYSYDRKSGYLMETSTYHVDILQANADNNPVWKLEYNATTTYNLTTLFPSSWDELTHSFATNDDLFNTYYTQITSGVEQGACDDDCRKSIICALRSATSSLQKPCLSHYNVSVGAYARPVKC
eukprot:TRINITY_DN3898_c0_g1_i1.p1 TRINITY_DN3898_c0_g1~~TRINITY_DN3898_c0_g1_i1.p1  ORF type:complete len:568 (-),score=132.38 TRINITY_DN3898_c0_g1_i1:24-1727(-)